MEVHCSIPSICPPRLILFMIQWWEENTILQASFASSPKLYLYSKKKSGRQIHLWLSPGPLYTQEPQTQSFLKLVHQTTQIRSLDGFQDSLFFLPLISYILRYPSFPSSFLPSPTLTIPTFFSHQQPDCKPDQVSPIPNALQWCDPKSSAQGPLWLLYALTWQRGILLPCSTRLLLGSCGGLKYTSSS